MKRQKLWVMLSSVFISCWGLGRGVPQTYREAVQMTVDRDQSLRKLGQLICENPDHFFPYASFVGKLKQAGTKGEDLDKVLWASFDPGSFQFAFIKTYLGYLRSDRDVCYEGFRKLKRLPGNPFFIEKWVAIYDYLGHRNRPSINVDGPFDNSITDLIIDLHSHRCSKSELMDLVKFHFVNSLQGPLNDTQIYFEILYMKSLLETGIKFDQVGHILDDLRNNVNASQVRYYLPLIDDLLVSTLDWKMQTKKVREILAEGLYFAEKYAIVDKIFDLEMKKIDSAVFLENQESGFLELERISEVFPQDQRSDLQELQILIRMGALYNLNGQVKEAEEILQKAYSLSEILDRAFFAEINQLLFQTCLIAGKNENARDYLQKALTFSVSNKQPVNVIKTLVLKLKLAGEKRPIQRHSWADFLNEAHQLSGLNNLDLYERLFYEFKEIHLPQFAYKTGELLLREDLTKEERIWILSYLYEISNEGTVMAYLPGPLSILRTFFFVKAAKEISQNLEGKIGQSSQLEEYLSRAQTMTIEQTYNKALQKFLVTLGVLILAGLIVVFGGHSSWGWYQGLKAKFIGPYKIFDCIGEGGMGIVYVAKSLKSKQTVALKVLRDRYVQNREFVEQFKREAELLQKMDHENIVKFLAFGEQKKKLYMVMEYLKGQNLKALLAQSWPLAEPVAKRIVMEVVEALCYLHEQGVVHGDLKTSNLFIQKNTSSSTSFFGPHAKWVKILDFGIAREIWVDDVEDDSFQGTLAYVAPELLSGEKANPQSDIYSFGVVLYELLAGVLPFLHSVPTVLAHQIINRNPEEPVKFAPNLSLQINRLILKCLRKDPQTRYASMEDLKHDLSVIRFY